MADQPKQALDDEFEDLTQTLQFDIERIVGGIEEEEAALDAGARPAHASAESADDDIDEREFEELEADCYVEALFRAPNGVASEEDDAQPQFDLVETRPVHIAVPSTPEQDDLGPTSTDPPSRRPGRPWGARVGRPAVAVAALGAAGILGLGAIGVISAVISAGRVQSQPTASAHVSPRGFDFERSQGVEPAASETQAVAPLPQVSGYTEILESGEAVLVQGLLLAVAEPMRLDFDEAAALCSAQAVAGLDRWRLASIGELRSLAARKALSHHKFWSSTPADIDGDARLVWTGRLAARPRAWDGARALCVHPVPAAVIATLERDLGPEPVDLMAQVAEQTVASPAAQDEAEAEDRPESSRVPSPAKVTPAAKIKSNIDDAIGIDRARARRVVVRHHKQLGSCLGDGDALNVVLEINAMGHVTRTHFESPQPTTELGRCVMKKTSQWSFPMGADVLAQGPGVWAEVAFHLER